MATNYSIVNIAAFEGSLRVLNLDPPVLTMAGFLSPEQCDALIHAAQASGRMTQSAVGGHNVDKKKEIRTSSTLAASAEVRQLALCLPHALPFLKAINPCPLPCCCHSPVQLLKEQPDLDAALEALLARARQLLPEGPPRGSNQFTKPSAPGQVSFELPQVAHYTQGEKGLPTHTADCDE